jgi:ketosteroid isomerase-like protein
MTINKNPCPAILMAALMVCTGAFAQEIPDDQVAVWSVVERQWSAVQNGDDDWTEELLAPDFVGWPNESPAPRNKASTRMWLEFLAKRWQGLTYELYPLSIVVHDDTAVAHYLYSTAGENRDGEPVTRNGRFTDVLIRTDGEWKFIARHGGDDPAG